eukprot:g9028.t1
MPSRGEDSRSGAISGDSAAPAALAMASGDQGGGGAEALRRFAATRAMKTGTTIAGVVFEGGVVLGADTRATGGTTVCDRNCDKIHILAANIACCGAGTSADAVRITEGVRLALLRMAGEMQACLPSSRFTVTRNRASNDDNGSEGGSNSNSNSTDVPLATRDSSLDVVQRQHLRVAAAAFLSKRHLFRYQGTVSAALVLGGVDEAGEHLYQIHEGGSFSEVEFTAMGSGSLAALSVLERGHREKLSEEEATELILQAIAAGIDNDLGSGSNIDVCVITHKRGLEHHRGAWKDPGVGDDARAGRKLAQEVGAMQQHQPGNLLDTSDDDLVEIGGAGGSRAWVGGVRRRTKGKSVMKVDHGEGGALRSFRSSALDDKVELL